MVYRKNLQITQEEIVEIQKAYSYKLLWFIAGITQSVQDQSWKGLQYTYYHNIRYITILLYNISLRNSLLFRNVFFI